MAETSQSGPRNMHTLVSVLYTVFASKGYPFKNIFDFTTSGVWDCVAAEERLPALHVSVDFIVLSFGIMGLLYVLLFVTLCPF